MKLLHITDLHLRVGQKYQHDQERFIHALCNSVKLDGDFDLIFFTGDLVNGGVPIYDKVNELFIQKLLASTALTSESFFMCQGNHDIVRSKEMESIVLRFNTFSSNEDLDFFVEDRNNREFLESLRNHEDFYLFQKEFYSQNNDTIHELYTIHKRNIGGHKIGIATINSAWRSRDSKTDRGNLLFPVSILKELISSLAGEDLKILLMHHPISDFKEFNYPEIEDLIFENFHLLLGGHVHKKKQSTFLSSEEGIFCCISPSTVSLHDSESPTGYSILDIDIETLGVSVINRIYHKQDNTFTTSSELEVQIPQNTIKHKQNELRKTLRKKFNIELEIAGDLLIGLEDGSSTRNFLELFTEPILKYTPRNDYSKERSNLGLVALSSVVQSNGSYLILGKDKSGKTSLLKKVKLDLLQNFSTFKSIPFYIDCLDFKQLEKEIDIVKLISRYYELNQQSAISMIESYHIKLLIDNYDPSIDLINSALINFFTTYKNVSFLATTEETISRNYESLRIADQQHANLFIHPITRKEVRQLVNKWNLPQEKQELIFAKIGNIFLQLNIPMNYWTVSLFIWVHNKYTSSNFHNSVDLINLYIDGTLERNTIAFDKNSKITFDDFKTFISELAFYLVKNHHQDSYSTTYIELIGFISAYRKSNIKFVIEEEEIISMLYRKGIVKKRHDERLTFRLNGVFEYFLAYYMKDNPAFSEEVVQDDHFYLSFSNELELCSGFNRRDKNLLNLIYSKTQTIFRATNEKYLAEGTPDENLLSRVSEAFDLTSPLKKFDQQKIKLSPEAQDEILTELQPLDIQHAEVERKKFYDAIEHNPENLEKALFILARVYRNSTIKDQELNNEVLDFILDSACNLGFVLIDDLGNFTDGPLNDEEGERLLIKLITGFIPLIIQSFVFDALAQNNLERLIRDKINELEKFETNQFKLIILYFLLIELNLKENIEEIDKLIKSTSIGVLRQTILIKLYYYLAFKCFDQPALENRIVAKLALLHSRLDPKFDRDQFNKKISAQKKFNLIERRRLK